MTRYLGHAPRGDPVKKNRFGNNGELEISALCLGTMNYGSRDDDATSYDMLDRYVADGGNFLDTANMYANWVEGGQGGESETLLGKWMKDRGNRDQLVIATKMGFAYQDVPTSSNTKIIEQEVEKSLERLGIETIDLYYTHSDDRDTPLEEQLGALDRLVKAGKVRCIGASNIKAWRIEEARWTSLNNDYARYACVQQRFTYLRPKVDADFAHQRSANDDLLEYCGHHSLPLLAYSPFLRGAYTRDDRPLPEQYQHADSDARMKALKSVAKHVGATPNQVILAWMLRQDIIPIIGASRPEQMDENLGGAAVELSDEQMELLTGAGA
jgi:aryl-alcohol dehydrogenase-like predicted oxidoreductase